MPSTLHSPFLRACALLALLAPGPLLAQKFAYSSPQTGMGEIYVVHIDGSGLTNVTNNPGHDFGPRWSPDGTRLLFRSDRHGGEPPPYVMNADGSEQTKLALDGDTLVTAQWSNDGTKILLTKDSGLGSAAYFATPDGGILTQVDALPANDGAVWSPDGTKILFTSGLQFDNPDLYVFNVAANATTHTQLNIGTDARIEGWSPDSSRILVRLNSSGSWAIYDATSGVMTHFSGPPFGYTASWSPDGSKILVTADEEAGYGDNVRYAVVNSDGSGQVDLSATFDAFDLQQVANLTWSPDGTKLVVESYPNGGEALHVVNADGSSLVSLGVGRWPFWAPDGSRVFFAFDSDDGTGLYAVKPDGRDREDLSDRFSFRFYEPFGDFTDAAPAISDGGVVLANLVPAVNTVSPLSIISIFGTAFSAGSVFYPNLDAEGKIDTILGGTCVEIGGQRAPIFAMTPNQANVQVPSPLTFGSLGVTVVRNCGQADELRSETATVTVEEATPAFFLYPPYQADGVIAARFNDGYAAVAAEGTISDGQGPSRPAKPGDIILLFGTGWGRTDADLSTGERGLGADPLHPSANPMVTFGGIPLTAEDVLYVGATPEAAGLYQLAVRVPATALPGPNQVVLTVYGKSTPVGPVVTIAAR